MCFELMRETFILASYRVIHSGNSGTTEVINSAIFSHRPYTMFVFTFSVINFFFNYARIF